MRTTFKSYLIESVVYEKFDISKAISYIKENCMDAWNSKCKIYRGMDASNGTFIQLGDAPKMQPRVSANTANYYNLITSHADSWKEYPPRNKSFICSTDRRYAGKYGELYRILPVDNAKIGVCPREDMWFSFNDTMRSLELNPSMANFSKLLEAYVLCIDLLIMDADDDTKPSSIGKTYEEMLKYFNHTDSILQAHKNEDADSIYTKILHTKARTILSAEILHSVFMFLKVVMKSKSTLSAIEELFSPSKNRFELATPKTLAKDKSEVWISDNCLFIPNSQLTQIEDEMHSGEGTVKRMFRRTSDAVADLHQRFTA